MRYSFTITGTVDLVDGADLADTIGPVRGFDRDENRTVDVELPPETAILALLVRAVTDGLDRPGLDDARIDNIDVKEPPTSS